MTRTADRSCLRTVCIAVWVGVMAVGSLGATVRGERPRDAEMRFAHHTVRNGLGNNAIRAIDQDAEGFIWIATDDGIDRFDGKRFKHYELDGLRYATQRYVLCFFEDRSGALWIGGSDGALNRFDPSTSRFHAVENLPPVLARSDINDIAQGTDGMLWIGTDNGLIEYDPDSGRETVIVADVASSVASIARDRAGALWVGTHVGVYVLDETSRTLTRVPLRPGEPATHNSMVLSLLAHPSGTVYVGTVGGLFAVDTERRTAAPVMESLPAGAFGVRTLAALDDDTLVAGVQLGGLAYVDLATRRVEWVRHDPRRPDSLAGNAVFALLVDRSGVLWVGDLIAGLSRYSPHSGLFRLYRNNPFDDSTLSGNYIRGICEAADGTLWVCTQFDGVNRLDPQTGESRRYRLETGSLPADGAYSVLQDRAGDVWVGFVGRNGLARMRRGTERFVPFPLGAKLDVHTLYEEGDGTLWVGTGRGVYEISKDRLSVARRPEYGRAESSGGQGNVQTILADRRGDLWIGYQGGLRRIVRPAGTSVDYGEQLGIKEPNFMVSSLLEARDGSIWIATKGAGVFRYDPGTEKVVPLATRDGAVHPNSYAVLEDANGSLWISTDKGIVKYDTRTQETLHFGPQHGLQGLEFNRQAFCRTRGGDMYFGGPDGLNGFTAETLGYSAVPPVVTISALAVNGVPTAPASDLDLDYTRNTIAVEVAVLDFDAPELNEVAVKLEGLDPEWVALSSTPQIVYANLQPGDYVLRVKGSNSSGVWNEAATPLWIHVRPPWWRTGWASIVFGVVALAMAGAAVAMVRYRMATRARIGEAMANARAAEETARAKSIFLANVSHEIRNPLNAVLGASHLLAETGLDETQRRYVTTIEAAGRALKALLGDLLDLSKFEAGVFALDEVAFDLRACVRESVDLIAYGAAQKRLALRCTIDDDVPAVVVSDPNRLRQVLLNLLSNAVKFTDRGEISIHVSSAALESDREPGGAFEICFTVADTGIGIPRERLDDIFESFAQVDDSRTRRFGGSGLGLAVSKQLSERMGGTIRVESEPGHGAVFHATIVARAAAVAVDEAARDASAAGLLEPPSRMRVLVADDDAVNRMVLCQMIEMMGSVADAVASGREALEAVMAAPYDVVLMDVHMPELDGISAMRGIRESSLPRPPRVIAVTADALSATREECLSAGMSAVLEKPVDPELLRRLLTDRDVVSAPRDVADEPVLDAAVHGNLELIAGRAGGWSARGLVDFFVETSADVFMEIEGALARGATAEVSRLAHQLSGSSRTIGARRVASASRRLESACVDGCAPDAIAEAVADLGRELALLRRELERAAEARSE